MHDLVRAVDSSRSTQWRRHGESIDVVLGDSDDLASLYDGASDPYPIVDMLALVDEVNMALATAHGDRDRQVIIMAVQGYDNVEIARAVGKQDGDYHGRQRSVGPSRVSQILSQSGLFKYAEKDRNGKGKRVKAIVSRSTEYKRRKDNEQSPK